MKADIVLGIQWGDEGKGRVVDSYCADYDVVARFGGGDNAGHTLVVDGANWQRRLLTNPPVVTVREQMGRGPFEAP